MQPKSNSISNKINLLKTFHLKFKILFFVSLAAVGCLKTESGSSEISAEKIFNSFIVQFPDTVAYKTEAKSYNWNYEQGLILEAFHRMWKLTSNQKYYSYLKKNIDYYIEPDGEIKTYKIGDYNLDNIAPGRQLLHLYSETKDDKYFKAAEKLIEQIQTQPRTSEGGFWHKQRYPNQMWLDGLYMAELFYAEYSVMVRKPDNFNDIVKQFLLIRKNLKDERTGLYYHGWDESREQKWSDPETGRSPSFWGRSIGWFMMALVDVLDFIPQENPERETIKNMFIDLADDLMKFMDEEKKLWYQVIDQKDRDGNYIETSSSLMFIYSFAKGVNKGYLPDHFLRSAEESYKSVLENFVTIDSNGNIYLQNTVSVGGLGGNPYRDGSYEYYLSEPIRVNDFKGYGPLMLSAIELQIAKSKIKN
jgi:unsaturated rhamnogalacturonyl hydrolase